MSMRNVSLPRIGRELIDASIVAVAFYVAYQVRYEGQVDPFHIKQYWVMVVPIILGRLITNYWFGLMRHKWRYVSTPDVSRIVASYFALSVALVVLRYSIPETSLVQFLRLPAGVIA